MRTKKDILIKVLSLGVGLAIAIVLIAKVFFELSYDSFYKDINQIYSIQTWYSMNGEEHDYGQVSGAVAVGFMDEVPGVEVGTRTIWTRMATRSLALWCVLIPASSRCSTALS